MVASGPAGEYGRRLRERQAELARCVREDQVVGTLRLITFAPCLIFLLLAIYVDTAFTWLIPLPLVPFVVLVVKHDRVRKARDRAARATSYYAAGLERVQDRFLQGPLGERFADVIHPYALDLDLFGRGSLFQALCTAVTRGGQERLAKWLREPAGREVIAARHKAILDLKPRLDLREDLAVLGGDLAHFEATAGLAAWGTAPPNLVSPAVRILAVLLGAATMITGIGAVSGYSRIPFFVCLVVQRYFARAVGRHVDHVVKGVQQPARQLDALSDLLARLEREQWSAPLLRQIAGRTAAEGILPSQAIRKLQSMFGYLEQRRNYAFAVFGGLMLWTQQWAFAIERWRARYGPHLEAWLDALAETEALSSLSAYAYEHPDDPFPEIVGGPPCFEAEALAHPLIPRDKAVQNSVALGGDARLLIVSGSNMSGKSTLLRALGVNAVLALAGAPIRAERLRMTPVHLAASIRTQDSLQEGVSRFYAEIKRLRQVVEIAETEPPALFLLDEILHGTNSHDRRIGAEAVARALLARGAIGLLTTHDLALAAIAEDPGVPARNVHFEDTIQDGRVAFDYHLRPGVVQRSNALELMRAVGLDV